MLHSARCISDGSLRGLLPLPPLTSHHIHAPRQTQPFPVPTLATLQQALCGGRRSERHQWAGGGDASGGGAAMGQLQVQLPAHACGVEGWRCRPASVLGQGCAWCEHADLAPSLIRLRSLRVCVKGAVPPSCRTLAGCRAVKAVSPKADPADATCPIPDCTPETTYSVWATAVHADGTKSPESNSDDFTTPKHRRGALWAGRMGGIKRCRTAACMARRPPDACLLHNRRPAQPYTQLQRSVDCCE